MNVLIVGTGSIGRRHIFHLSNLLNNPDFSIVRRSGVHDDFSKSINANIVSSLSDLSCAPDIFIIASPSAHHFQYIHQGLDRCIPMYIEKPLVSSRADLISLQEIIKSKPELPITQCGCNLRFLPSLQNLKSLIANGHVGRIVRASFESGQWLPDWRPDQDYRSSYSANPYEGGGVCLDLMHEVDMALWLLGPMTVLSAYNAFFTMPGHTL